MGSSGGSKGGKDKGGGSADLQLSESYYKMVRAGAVGRWGGCDCQLA